VDEQTLFSVGRVGEAEATAFAEWTRK
jgi:hypothetical protein